MPKREMRILLHIEKIEKSCETGISGSFLIHTEKIETM